MSEAPSSAPSGGDASSGASQHTDPVAAVDAAEEALRRRIGEKRARAENARNGVTDPAAKQQQQGKGARERGDDGKFKPRGAQGAQGQQAQGKPQGDDVDLKAKPGAKPDEQEKDSPEIEKIKAEAKKHQERADALTKQYAEAETTMGQALARINALEALIERYQKAGAKLDPIHVENLSLKERIEAQDIMRQSAEAKAAEDAKAAEEAAKQADVQALKDASQELFADGHPLNPFAPDGMSDDARQFWGIVAAVNNTDGAKEALATLKRLAPRFAAAAKARALEPTGEARTLKNLAGPAKGAAARDLSREGILAKYTSRLRGA